MSSSSIMMKPWQWACLLLMPGVFFGIWKGIIRPHEIKRLRVEASQAANSVVNGFSSHLYQDLNLIEQTFLSLKHQTYGTQAAIIDALNEQFDQAEALEAFVLPPVGEDSALVFFNPYVMYPKVQLAEKRCTDALKTYPRRLENYRNLTLIPLNLKKAVEI